MTDHMFTCRIPSQVHDELIALAEERGETVSTLTRDILLAGVLGMHIENHLDRVRSHLLELLPLLPVRNEASGQPVQISDAALPSPPEPPILRVLEPQERRAETHLDDARPSDLLARLDSLQDALGIIGARVNGTSATAPMDVMVQQIWYGLLRFVNESLGRDAVTRIRERSIHNARQATTGSGDRADDANIA